MINVPSNTGQDWDSLIVEARQSICRKLSQQLEINLESHILTEEILEPRTIESKTASFQGSLYGSASNNKTAAFFRHSNFSNDIRGLYFCGECSPWWWYSFSTFFCKNCRWFFLNT